MKKQTLFSVGTLIFGIVLFVIAIRIIGVQTVIQQFRLFQPRQIAFYLAISSAIVLVVVVKWQFILKSMDYKIPLWNLFQYRQMGYAVGYVIPSFSVGGETVRAFFLSKSKVPMTKALSSVIIDRAVELPMNFLLACVMYFLVARSIAIPEGYLIGFGALILVFIMIGLLFFYKMYQKEYFFTPIISALGLNRFSHIARFREQIKEIETNLIMFFNHKRKYFFISLVFSSILWLLMVLEFRTALLLVGYEATITQIYLVVVMTGFAMVFPIPASVGIMEFSQIAIAIVVGIPPAVAVALSLLVRTRDFMWILTGIIFYIYHGADYVKALLTNITNGDGKGHP